MSGWTIAPGARGTGSRLVSPTYIGARGTRPVHNIVRQHLAGSQGCGPGFRAGLPGFARINGGIGGLGFFKLAWGTCIDKMPFLERDRMTEMNIPPPPGKQVFVTLELQNWETRVADPGAAFRSICATDGTLDTPLTPDSQLVLVRQPSL
jgi:hypothetical protein